MKIVAFAGSLRQRSYSRSALKVAVEILETAGVEVEVLDLNDYPMPGYNQDIEDNGMPEVVENFKAKVNAADGVLIATPEYNHGVPGVLKNIIDWASRKSPQLQDVFRDKTVGVISVSDGSFGGVRAQMAWLPTFRTLGMILYPAQQPVPTAQDSFDGEGNITDERLKERLTKFAQGFFAFTQKHSL